MCSRKRSCVSRSSSTSSQFGDPLVAAFEFVLQFADALVRQRKELESNDSIFERSLKCCSIRNGNNRSTILLQLSSAIEMHPVYGCILSQFQQGFLNNDGHFHSFRGVETGLENSSGGVIRGRGPTAITLRDRFIAPMLAAADPACRRCRRPKLE